MELEARLRAFAAVARRHSFSAAARELRISQPAVSKHVADIEQRLRVRLLERRPRGGELTAAGAFLADHVLRAQALLAQAARGVTEFGRPGVGSLTIAASGVPATHLLPEVTIAFQRGYPGVQVRIVSRPSAQAMGLLRAHRAEFGVIGGFAAAPEIEAEPLLEEDIVVVGLQPHRRRGRAAPWLARAIAAARLEGAPHHLDRAPPRRHVDAVRARVRGDAPGALEQDAGASTRPASLRISADASTAVGCAGSQRSRMCTRRERRAMCTTYVAIRGATGELQNAHGKE